MHQQLPHFDFFRGIAAILVYFFHYLFIVDFHFREISEYNFIGDVPNKLRIIFNLIPIGYGNTGVHLFLVISGFLIYYGYLNSKNTFSWPNYVIRRFWRIYPPYFITLVFFSTYHCSWDVITFKDILTHLLFIHNLELTTFYTINATFWSLGLEVQLYIFFPLLVFILTKLSLKQFLIFSIILSASINLIFIQMGLIGPNFEKSILTYGFLWFLGAYGAEQYFLQKPLWNSSFPKISLIVILFYLILIFFRHALPYVEVIYLGIFWALLIDLFLWKVDPNKCKKNLAYEFISFCGKISFGIYLFHAPFLLPLHLWFKENGPQLPFYGSHILASITIFLLIIMVSYFFYEIIEKKSIEIGKNLLKNK